MKAKRNRHRRLRRPDANHRAVHSHVLFMNQTTTALNVNQLSLADRFDFEPHFLTFEIEFNKEKLGNHVCVTSSFRSVQTSL